MFGRFDITNDAICRDCMGSGINRKKRKKPCPFCGGSGRQWRCTTCGGIYGETCLDTTMDQTFCSMKEKIVDKEKNLQYCDIMKEELELDGAFFANLNRNNKAIKKDRAISITEDAQLLYKREIEDMQTDLKRLKRDRVNMLDLSPSDTNSLKLASDFDAKDFVTKDIEIGVKIRNLEIKLEIATKQYDYLFGNVSEKEEN